MILLIFFPTVGPFIFLGITCIAKKIMVRQLQNNFSPQMEKDKCYKNFPGQFYLFYFLSIVISLYIGLILRITSTRSEDVTDSFILRSQWLRGLSCKCCVFFSTIKGKKHISLHVTFFLWSFVSLSKWSWLFINCLKVECEDSFLYPQKSCNMLPHMVLAMFVIMPQTKQVKVYVGLDNTKQNYLAKYS